MSQATEPSRAPEEGQRLDQRLLAPRMFNLLGLIRRVGVRAVRRELGLSEFEWLVMSHVGQRPLTFTELAERMGHDKGQLSRGVTRLVESGLLTRQRRRASRSVVIAASQEGQKVFERLIAMAILGQNKLVQGVSPQDLDTFVGVMEQMKANASALLAAREGEPDET